jgi:phosphate transport system protein
MAHGTQAALPSFMKKPHSEPSYDVDLERIRALVDDMAALVGEMLAGSLQCLAQRDGGRAKDVAARDREVNALEVELDERCLKLLARWQPVASDLRFVGATLKLVTDLERVGDHCVNICSCVLDLEGEHVDPPADLQALGGAVPALLQDALTAWRAEDAQMAGQVIERGQRIEVLVRAVVRGCFEASQRDPGSITAVIRWHEVAGYLQRIAAHATNVAELVVFLVRGEDIRHAGRLPVGAHRSQP